MAINCLPVFLQETLKKKENHGGQGQIINNK